MECTSCAKAIPAKPGSCPICGAPVALPSALRDERLRRLEDAYRGGRIGYEEYKTNVRRLQTVQP